MRNLLAVGVAMIPSVALFHRLARPLTASAIISKRLSTSTTAIPGRRTKLGEAAN